VTPKDFRKLALELPEAVESAHMDHPDFRVGGKIFATLGYPDNFHAMAILPPEDQQKLLVEHPNIFTPAAGAWGRRGSTVMRLAAIDQKKLQPILLIAWRKAAPARLVKEYR